MINQVYKKYGLLGSIFYSVVAGPTANFCVRFGVSPNAVTIIGFLIYLMGCYFLTSDRLDLRVLGFALLHLGVTFDYADGIVARKTGHTSFFGGWLDNSLDRAADFAVFVPLAISVALQSSLSQSAIIALVAYGAFSLIYPHYIHDIAYFHSVGSGVDKAETEGKATTGLGRYFSSFGSAWLRMFNRDMFVFVMSLGLLFEVFLFPFIFVVLISTANICLLGAREYVRAQNA